MVSHGFSQEVSKACLDLVRAAYHQMNSTEKYPGSDNIYFLNYDLSVFMRDSLKYPPQKTQIRILKKQLRSHMVSEELSVYQDSMDVFTIMDDRKTIYRDKPGSLQLINQARTAQAIMLQDTLLALGEVVECNNIDGRKKKADKQITLAFTEEDRKVLPYERLTFHIDSKNNYIHKILVRYPAAHQMARIEIVYKELNYNYKTTLLDKPVASLIFDSKGKLLPKYKKYTMVDNRIHKQ